MNSPPTDQCILRTETQGCKGLDMCRGGTADKDGLWSSSPQTTSAIRSPHCRGPVVQVSDLMSD